MASALPSRDALTAPLTDLFHRYVRAREEGRAVDEEELCARAGDAAPELRARIRGYELVQRAARRMAERDGAVPTRIGRFEVEEALGAGGLGRVYLARDPELERRVALKVLDGAAALDESERAWIRNEARSLARVAHPGVVRVFEVGSDGGRDYVAMEPLPGPSLAAAIAALRRLRGRDAPGDGDPAPPEGRAGELARSLEPFRARARLLLALADALATCHDQGVLHRDVKPDNVLFDADGAPRLIDFGLAHLPEEVGGRTLVTQRLLGTPAYVAPEQVESGRTGTDPRSDQFSFGALAYELLALERPFERGTRTATLAAVVEATPRAPRRVDPTVPPDLERVVLHCLERAPERRYPGMAAVAEDLRAFLESRPVSVGAPSLASLLALSLRRHRRRYVAGALAAGAAALALVLAGLLGHARAEESVVDALAALAPGGATRPHEFEDRLLALEGLHARARRLDASLLGALAPGRLAPRVEEALERTSVELAGAVVRARAESGARGVSFQGRTWRHVLDLEERVCPGCTGTRALRQLGRILPPEGAEGLRHLLLQRTELGPDPGWKGVSVARPIDLVSRPTTGAYRWIVWDAAGTEVLWEAERVLEDAWSAPWELRVGRRDARLLARTVEVARGEEPVTPLTGGPTPVSVLVPRFRITPEPVTRAELARFRAATGLVPPAAEVGGARPDAAPAWVTAVEAEAFASWAGGRLPTAVELWRFVRATGTALPPLGPAGHGEWVSDPSTLSGYRTRTFVKYGAAESADDELSWRFVEGPGAFAVVQRVGPDRGPAAEVGLAFRVVFTTDDEATVRRAGEERP